MSRADPIGAGPCARCARGLSLADWPAVARATVLLAAVFVAVRVLPFGAVHRCVLGARATGDARCRGCALRALNAAAVLLGRRPTCLARAIVLSRMLRRSGRDAGVVVGVSRDGGFAAHAWVELAGHPFGSDGDQAARYQVLCRLTGADPVGVGTSGGGP